MYTVIVLYMFHKYIILIYFMSRHFRKPLKKFFGEIHRKAETDSAEKKF